MPGDKRSMPTNRPRLLSDILETPLSDSAIPDEYTMYRPPLSPALRPGGDRQAAQKRLSHDQLGSSLKNSTNDNASATTASGPGVIGNTPQRMSSINLCQTLTPNSFPPVNCGNQNRRSTPTVMPIFTTSPAVSEPGSPSQSQLTPQDESFSQASLHPYNTPSRPRTPTPSSAGLQVRGQSDSRSSSLPSIAKRRGATSHPHGKPSVKHLTCYWWKVKGICRFSEKDCLYAHRDTGLFADAPRQLMPGEPAKAGRSLEKAMRANLSSSSLNTSMVANPPTPENQRTSTRASTPDSGQSLQERLVALQTESYFLRNLVEQSSKEKDVFMSTIQDMQKENFNLNKDVEFLKDLVEGLQQEQRQAGGKALDDRSLEALKERKEQQ